MKISHILATVISVLFVYNSTLLAKEAPFELTSDGDSKIENGITTIWNNAQIKYDGITVHADQIEYNPKTGEARLFKKSDKNSSPTLVATLKIQKE